MPLVDLTIPVDFGLAPRGLEGGKAGLRLGKGGRDVFAECRLVLLHRQDVIASPFDHLRTKSAMREHRVARDDLVLDRQHRQEFQSGLVLVGLGIDPELGQNRFDVRGVGGHQVDAGRATVATPPGGLAVDGQVRGVVLPELRLNPPANTRLEVDDVDPAKDPRIGIGVARPLARRKSLFSRPPRPHRP